MTNEKVARNPIILTNKDEIEIMDMILSNLEVEQNDFSTIIDYSQLVELIPTKEGAIKLLELKLKFGEKVSDKLIESLGYKWYVYDAGVIGLYLKKMQSLPEAITTEELIEVLISM